MDINARIVEYLPLSRKISWDYYRRATDPVDYDDIFGTACLALVQGAQSFAGRKNIQGEGVTEEERNRFFGAYVSVCIHNRLKDYGAWNKKHTWGVLSIDTTLSTQESEDDGERNGANGPYNSQISEAITYVEEMFDCLETFTDLYPFMLSLPKRERKLLEMRLKSYDKAQCGKELGSDVRTVTEMLRRMYRKYLTFQQDLAVSTV
jgi:RNA polymerase sigma factor (sigma-70 family)